MKKLFLPLAALLAAASPLLSAVSSSESTFQGQKSIVIENELLRLTFVPEKGGRCMSFKDLKTGFEFIDPNHHGLFGDHWANFSWPSGLMHLPYTAKVSGTPDSVSVTLSVTVPEKGGGKGDPVKERSGVIPTGPELTGLVLSKTVTLKSGSPLVGIRQTLENPTGVSKSAALSFQHHFKPGGSGARISSLPDSEGLIGPALEFREAKVSGKNWCNSPISGWNCIYDPKEKQGLVFAFDYNLTDKIYSSGLTAEWFLESVTLAPGGKFETDYFVRVVRDLNEIVYASGTLAAGVLFREDPAPVSADFSFLSMDGKKRSVDLECEVWSAKQGKVIEKKRFPGVELGAVPKVLTVSAPVGKPSVTDYTVFRWTVSLKDGTKELFENNYIGNENEFRRRYHFGEIGAGAAALTGGEATNVYHADPPVKVRKRPRFDLKAIRAKAGKADSVLVLFGLFTNYLRIHEALHGTFGKSLHWANGIPTGIQGFPGTREELFRNKLVVMSNINFKALRHSGLFMLDDFVREGGTLLICGGFYTFGHGEFKGSVFEEFVPVEGMRPFEIVHAEKGRPFHLKKTGANHPLSAALNIDENNEVFYLHDLKAKKDSVVLASAGDRPAIILRKHGRGRVIACTPTVMGETEKPWYDGVWWKEFLKELAK